MIGLIVSLKKQKHLQRYNHIQPPDMANFFHGGCIYQ